MDFSWQVIVTVFTLGGIGAVVRALVLNILGIVSLFYFPLGVLFINMLACFLGGFIIAMLLPEALNIAFVIGLVGGMGTLSSISSDVLDLYFDKVHRKVALLLGVIYLALTAALGMGCAQGGLSLGEFIRGDVFSDDPLEQARQMELQRMMQSLEEAQDLGIGEEELHLHEHNLPTDNTSSADGSADGSADSSASDSAEQAIDDAGATDAAGAPATPHQEAL